MTNAPQVSKALARVALPLAKRGQLCAGNVRPGGRLAVFRSLHQSRDERLAGGLARGRGREEDLLQDGKPAILRILEVLREARLLEMHDVLTAARSGAHEDHTTKDRRPVLGHLLGDHATERETENVAGLDSKSVEKGHGVFCHSGDRRRDVAGGTPNAGVVEEDDLPSGGKRISHSWIPVVERPGEVLLAEQRQPRAIAESTVGVGMAVHLQELCGSGRSKHITHPFASRLPSCSRATATSSALVCARPPRPHPPSGASVSNTQTRSLTDSSVAAAATIRVSSATTLSCFSRSRPPAFVSTWTRMQAESPSTFDRLSGGSSCTNAAVFWRNSGMFGTRSIVITAVARSRASFARSRKVPAGAYTSIMGMLAGRALDDAGDVLRPRDEDEMPSGQLSHVGMHPLRHEARELRIDCAILRPNDIPCRHGLPGRRDGEWLAERAAGNRLLRRRECARLSRRQAVGEHLGILRYVDVKETRRILDERLAEAEIGVALEQRPEGFTRIGRERRHIDE